MKKSNAKIGIFMSAILMMGVIGVSSSLAVIAQKFNMQIVDVVACLISISCLAMIPVTILSGILMSYIPKKVLLIAGIILFIVGGVLPSQAGSFQMIVALRALFGIGIGIIQPTCSSLVAENYEGAERDRTMGTMNSFQMLGCMLMSILGGQLGATANGAVNVFYVHLIGIVSLICAIIFIPYKKPVKQEKSSTGSGSLQITGGLIGWVLLYFVFMIAGQIFSNNASSLITNLGIGTAAEAGRTLAAFALGGFVMGFLFGKIFAALKNITMPVGFFILALSYVIMAFGTSMVLQYIGAFVCGLAFSIAMPLFATGSSAFVNEATASFAIALTTCFQNLGMTVCPYVVDPVSTKMTVEGGLTKDQNALLFGAILIGIFGVIFMIRGLRLNNQSGR